MVTPEDREKLAELLLPRYIVDVTKILVEKKIHPEKEKPYDPGHISNVFNGVYENLDIEAAFYEVYEARKAKKEEIEWKRNRLMSDKQPA